ncbi:methylation site containing protein [Psychromonas sp. CNPT3]|uniref:GspH/FimT family pseudopilin n=1 Tax=Psychromonas sp. CNPT3 TaxID=314282 RepID=UPI00006E7660|nr:GspH/FimT family pseudopilin [Psychromonas sp. CNPT3]AGH80362.1 methylation site containing protein [Psychromonas sp. CNPT3]
MSLQKGFTLIESLIVFAIIAVLFMIAVPSMSSLTQKSRVKAGANNLTMLLTYARNQSINTLQNITICPLSATNNCTKIWGNGIDIFIDKNKNKILDTEDMLLKKGQKIHAKDTLIFPTDGITFTPQGAVTNLPSTPIFHYCSADMHMRIKLSFNGKSKTEHVDDMTKCITK